MKKKLTALLMAGMMCIASLWCGNTEVQAAEEVQSVDIDYSYLTCEGALMGYANMQTWGVYLSEGTSSITKLGTNTIGAGGTTTAAVKCRVSISCIVERYVDGSWLRVTSWTQTNENAYSAMISKSLIVATNNTYRVRSLHYAGTDYSSSYTNNLTLK